MRSRHRHRIPHVAAAAVLAAVVVVTGCSEDGGSRAVDPEAPSVDERGAHDGEVCPDRLPLGDDPGYGFGTDEPAESSPSLPDPDAAWVCRYDPVEAGPGPDGDGTSTAWELHGGARPVESAQLADLARDLTELVPAETHRMCTADLGPRWMLVVAHDDDLTGVVVDAFGCRDIRMTDEPFETPPGEATQPGTVSGVLTGPEAFLDRLKAVTGG